MFYECEEDVRVGDDIFKLLLGMPTFAKLPQSITSLAVSSELLDLIVLQGVMAQLPNLDDFFLSKVLIITKLGTLTRQSYDRDLVEGCILAFNLSVRVW